jgi:predicted kinase
MNQSVRDIRDIIIKNLIEFGQSIIIDAWNIRRITRTRILNLKKHSTKNIETIIIKCNIEEKDLLTRLEQRDTESKNKTKRNKFYLTKKIYEIEELENNETTHILEFTQNNTKDILSKLKYILQ